MGAFLALLCYLSLSLFLDQSRGLFSYEGFDYKKQDENEIEKKPIIENNQANYGGGIFITNSDPIINNIEVFNNNAINGAGIFINLYSNVNIFITYMIV